MAHLEYCAKQIHSANPCTCPEEYEKRKENAELAALRGEVEKERERHATVVAAYNKACEDNERLEAALSRYREAVRWAVEQIWIDSPDKATTVKELRRRAGEEK